MFQFVPRKVTHKSSHISQPSVPSSTASARTAAPSSPQASSSAHAPDIKGKGKSTEHTVKDEDLAALISLSISDYNLWANVDLRRAIANALDGWIPLSYLLQQSTYLHHIGTRPPDTALVKAVRSHAQDSLEVRMLVTSPSKAAWYGKDSEKDEQGGYEIRRKDWSDALIRVRNSTRHEWEARTIYMESIPLPFRSIPGIYRFAASLLATSSSPSSNTRVECITLPPHHLDRPGDLPKCKGFALVTFASQEDAEHIVHGWPWQPRRTSAPSEASDSVLSDAVKFGFRTLKKARWDELKEEYLAYRQSLLDEIAGARSPPDDPARSTLQVASHATAEREESAAVEAAVPLTKPSLDPSAPFPPGCLVFVRNVHPETNKTTLKTLFTAHAFGPDSACAPSPSCALDYVDYSKGMTSCHLRLSTPQHAQTLVSAFQTRPLVQLQGLDGAGAPPAGSARPIVAEIVDGEREELYWNKVPEKVRREAIRKAIAQMAGEGDGHGEDGGGDGGGGEDEAVAEGKGRRPRKRRRKA